MNTLKGVALRHRPGRAGAGGGHALGRRTKRFAGHREPVRAGQGRGGAGPIRGALLGRVAPPHYPVYVRPGLPRRHPPPCRAKRRTGRRRGGADPASLKPDLLPLTVPEVRRLIAAIALHRPSRPDAALRWSTWRRRHQQRAKRAHWHRRTQGHPVKPSCSTSGQQPSATAALPGSHRQARTRPRTGRHRRGPP